MADWFFWKGDNSTKHGVHVASQPTVTLASERMSTVSIPGRSGALIQKEGDNVYEPINYTLSCFVDHMSDDELLKLDDWLSGSGELIIASRPNGYYLATITSALAPSVIVRGNPHRSFSITFTCQPYLYRRCSDIVCSNNQILNNNYSLASKPIVTITAENVEGVTELVIGNYTVMFGENAFSEGNLTLDCENLIAFSEVEDGVYINHCTDITVGYSDSDGNFINDDVWPELDPGLNVISWDTGAGITGVTINPNWRSR